MAEFHVLVPPVQGVLVYSAQASAILLQALQDHPHASLAFCYTNQLTRGNVGGEGYFFPDYSLALLASPNDPLPVGDLCRPAPPASGWECTGGPIGEALSPTSPVQCATPSCGHAADASRASPASGDEANMGLGQTEPDLNLGSVHHLGGLAAADNAAEASSGEAGASTSEATASGGMAAASGSGAGVTAQHMEQQGQQHCYWTQVQRAGLWEESLSKESREAEWQRWRDLPQEVLARGQGQGQAGMPHGQPAEYEVWGFSMVTEPWFV